jgi:hypothetical protein
LSRLKTILLIINFSFLGVLIGQNDSNEVKKKDTLRIKNTTVIDVDWISATFSYKRKLSKKLKMGISIGYGISVKPVLNNLFIGDYEIFSIGIPLQYQVVKLIHIEIEPRYARLRDINFNKENTVGIGTGVFLGGKKIQYGFKTMFGRTTFSDPDYFISNTYLVLRFLVVKW